MASISEFLLGSPARTEQVQRYTPQQTGGINQSLNMALQGLQNPTAGFQPIEQQAREQFRQQTIPSIAERFTSMGAQRSSAFPQLLSQAGAGLESNLAGMKSQYGLQNKSQLMQLLGLGLTPQFDTVQHGETGGLIQALLSALAGGAGNLIPFGLNSLFGNQGSSNMGQSN